MPHDSRFRGELGQQLRVDSVRASAAAGSGHPTSSMSAADLLAVLVDGHLRLDYSDPANPDNDHLIFSKGHASPLYYAVLKAVGAIDDAELLTFRKFGSRLEGHPTPRIPPTDVATGSLGQGLPIGVGLALAGARLDRTGYRTWVLCGDSELAEGSIWEAFNYAGWAKLANLTAIVDVNRLGQTRETMFGWDLDVYRDRALAFGWHPIEVDGHDLDAIDRAYTEAVSTTDRPSVILARTVKGKGVAAVADQLGKHGKPLDDPDAAIVELGGERDLRVSVPHPAPATPHSFAAPGATPPRYELGEQVATRAAYGKALAALGSARGDIVALDGEVSNSTHAEDFHAAHPDRYFEMFIAEQQLVAAAVGIQARGWVPYASTFAAFLSRAYDFIRMAAISRANLRLVGSHAGVSIGQDGPSQMALEDFAALRAVHGSCVLHPSDANQTVQLVAEMADRRGICYLRTLRGATEVRTPPDEPVHIGGSRVALGADATDAAVLACGATLPEAIGAAQRLAADGIRVRVLDCYSIKPLDADAVVAAADECGLLVTVEDHWPEGGLGAAVLSTLADAKRRPVVRRLAVRGMPGSGTPAELMHEAGIDADAIVDAVRTT
ncbi:transketolase [Actinocatenispora thailandica]|uniref:Transketolase n=1 Tax=Actinocatenispora thailandica TaxID=227318 RepID=A0A7R7HYR5_9ACTN|nr:transketolase [Actinocatenispora thailandica]BCJ36544.1 transketolase [Actinocatenispora thailandica]